MIYCVVPRELEADLYDRLVAYYEGNAGVTVIVDRRHGPDRRRGKTAGGFAEQRLLRDRRRMRIPGTLPSIHIPDA